MICIKVTRTFANTTDNKSDDKPKAKSTTRKTPDTRSKASDTHSKAPAPKVETLGKPGRPSDKYEAPEYFKYDEYSYNDLISEMEKFRNPQPAPK